MKNTNEHPIRADLHTHLTDWYNCIDGKTYSYMQTMEVYRKAAELDYVNIACLPFGSDRDVSQNLMAGLMKLQNQHFYVHGGLMYQELPVKLPFDPAFTPLKQAQEMTEMGFDGIKMLEGKPGYRKNLGISLAGPEYDDYFSYLEENQIHLLWHVNDPANFWNRSTLPKAFIDRGWYYDRPGYMTYEEIYEEVYTILDRHPNLKVTFAHFFFLSEQPERLKALFETYPNVTVDLTPGNEMYVNMAKNWNALSVYLKRTVIGFYSGRITTAIPLLRQHFLKTG